MNAPQAPPRWVVFARKMAGMLLVITSLTTGIIGLGVVTGGRWWGVLLLIAAPIGIWAATRVTPDGATTGYFDQNL